MGISNNNDGNSGVRQAVEHFFFPCVPFTCCFVFLIQPFPLNYRFHTIYYFHMYKIVIQQFLGKKKIQFESASLYIWVAQLKYDLNVLNYLCF